MLSHRFSDRRVLGRHFLVRAATLVATVGSAMTQALAAPLPLFDDMPTVADAASRIQSLKPGTLRTRSILVHPTTLENMANVLVNEKAGKKKGKGLGTMILNLFPDVAENSVVEEIEMQGGKRWILRGHTQDGRGSFTFVSWDGALTGQVELDHTRFSIHPKDMSSPTDEASKLSAAGVVSSGKVIHEIDEIDLQNWSEAWNEKLDDAVIPQSSASADPSTGLSSVLPSAENPVIDILVAYDSPSTNASLESLSTLAVDLANQAYEANQLPQRLRLVQKQFLPVPAGVDGSSGSSILSNLSGMTDALRTQYGADLVSYISPNLTGVCGIAYVLNHQAGNPGAAFSVTAAGCIPGNFSFTHELGHNMGAMHDSCTTTQPGFFADSHGFIDVNRNIRSVMSYSYGSTVRLNRFSSTSVEYQGAMLGSPASSTSTCKPEPGANNSRALAASAPLIAAYRPSKTEIKNIPPVSVAGPDRMVRPNASASLDGSKSYDPDQGALTYSWVQFKKDPRKVAITNAKTAKASVSPKFRGTYRFRLTVTDPSGATSVDAMTVRVK